MSCERIGLVWRLRLQLIIANLNLENRVIMNTSFSFAEEDSIYRSSSFVMSRFLYRVITLREDRLLSRIKVNRYIINIDLFLDYLPRFLPYVLIWMQEPAPSPLSNSELSNSWLPLSKVLIIYKVEAFPIPVCREFFWLENTNFYS